MKVGDKVGYIPDLCHALQKSIKGSYPFIFGRKVAPARRVLPNRPSDPMIEELSSREASEFIDGMKRSPQPAQMRELLVIIRPNGYWPAVVRNVNEDGTVNVDIESHNGGVTLHCDKVPVDSTATKPHTCHELLANEQEQ